MVALEEFVEGVWPFKSTELSAFKLECRLCPAAMILIASIAIKTPVTPTTGPSMPPSPQLTTLSIGGGLGNMHL